MTAEAPYFPAPARRAGAPAQHHLATSGAQAFLRVPAPLAAPRLAAGFARRRLGVAQRVLGVLDAVREQLLGAG
jgi:hypothetical protein